MKKLLAILLIAAMLMAGCGEAAEPTEDTTVATTEATEPATDPAPENNAFAFTLDNYPKMGGSLACKPLGQAVTATALGTDRESADGLIVFEGSTTDNYKWLLDGTFDIVLVYEPSEEAKALMENSECGVEMTPIGADGLVFIGNKDNPVTNLTYEDIAGIYSGDITNWQELGGKDEEIVPFQRNKDSGSQTLFDKLINLGDDLMKAPADLMSGSMIGLLEAVADYDGSDGAMGYTVYYYLTNMEAGTLQTAKIFDYEGVTPSNDTIASGEYKLSCDFYVAIRADAAEDSPERILYNWICSDQGKELIIRENYAAK